MLERILSTMRAPALVTLAVTGCAATGTPAYGDELQADEEIGSLFKGDESERIQEDSSLDIPPSDKFLYLGVLDLHQSSEEVWSEHTVRSGSPVGKYLSR